MGFADSVKATASKMQQQVNDKAVDIATELFTTAVKLTPVSSPKEPKRGELVNNWNTGIGVDAYDKSYNPSFDVSGSASLQGITKLKGSQEFLSKDGEVSLTNVVGYGYRAEYAGWPAPRWNDSKPYAMMRNALIMVAPKYKG